MLLVFAVITALLAALAGKACRCVSCPEAGAVIFLAGDCTLCLSGGFNDKSGCALTNALKLGSVFGSGIFQGNRLRIMHMKIMATLQTSVFLGS
jgi:hypothetical protein